MDHRTIMTTHIYEKEVIWRLHLQEEISYIDGGSTGQYKILITYNTIPEEKAPILGESISLNNTDILAEMSLQRAIAMFNLKVQYYAFDVLST